MSVCCRTVLFCVEIKHDIISEAIRLLNFIMKPIMMHGHERSITQIKYNREGDLLFSCAKVRIF